MTERDHDRAQRTADIVARFDRAASTYELTGVDFFTTFGARLVEHAAPRTGDHVLDVGCGTGAVLVPAARAVGPTGRVVGLDLAESMVQRCRAAIDDQDLHWAEAHVGDAGAPSVEPGSFDQVLAGLVVFFLPDHRAALDAYRAALVPSGLLGFTTFGPQDQRFAPVFAAVSAHVPGATDDADDDATAARRAQHGPFATAASITSLLDAAGFVDVQHHDDHQDVRFEGPDHWIRWSWSHGMRELWEAVPPASLPAAERDVAEVLDGLSGADRLVQHWVVRTTLARTPAGRRPDRR